jgi:hypothetical protein
MMPDGMYAKFQTKYLNHADKYKNCMLESGDYITLKLLHHVYCVSVHLKKTSIWIPRHFPAVLRPSH